MSSIFGASLLTTLAPQSILCCQCHSSITATTYSRNFSILKAQNEYRAQLNAAAPLNLRITYPNLSVASISMKTTKCHSPLSVTI
ncbi:hypothetical protein M758_4G123100 [Ceratodon purpureus]|nr:hypothetical protein M758_4G123100 [Ceratodon purpureus]